ncbi:MAG: PAS domain S-box protein [Candidatus Thorarchaeota archaeon]
MTKKSSREGTTPLSSDFEFKLGDIRLDEQALYLILEHSHDAVVLLGTDYKFEYISEEGYKMIQAKKGELIGSDFREFIHEDDRATISQRYTDRMKGMDVPDSYRIKVYDTRKNVQYADLRVTLINTIDGQKKLLVLIQNRTEEILSRNALKESEERYRTLIETMNDGLVIDDSDLKLTYANDAFCRMLGYDRNEIVGKCWLDFTQNTDRKTMESKLYARKKGESERYELQWITKSGHIVPTIISAVPLYNGEGAFLGTFGVVTDITTQKETEESVQFYLDLLTHDVANQLQVIMTATGLLDHELPKSYLDDARQDIVDAVQRCNRLITKVKRAGQTRLLPMTSMDLSTVIKEKAAVLERVYSAKVDLKGVDETALVWADALLGELVWNLLENSARHNPTEKRKVWVSTTRKNGIFQLNISDNGPGISEAKKQTIFDKSKRSGGVGLTLVAQMIRKYGGSISIVDRVKGDPAKGAKFIITLKEAKSDRE